MATPAAASIRERQTVALKRMLNFNETHVKNSTGEPVWKVLIYDRFGQDIISPLLSVKELRDMGITLHLLLHSDRDPIPDVPAVYFVMPTEENIDRMCQDLRNQLYESYYLNFISAISRSKLEDIANAALAASAVTQVAKVRNFGAVPIIRCSRGTAAEMVAVKLDKKLRENLRDARNSLFTGDTLGAGQFSIRFVDELDVRSLNRGVEEHSKVLAFATDRYYLKWERKEQFQDFHLNRVNLEESSGVENSPAGARPKRKNKKSYDLTPVDKFWQKHKGSPFPEVAESVQQELESYRAQEDEVKRLKSIMGLEGEDEGAISMLSDNTAKLTSAVSSLPELLEKKRLIDLHTNVATAVLEHIKARKLDVYFEYEEKIMSKTTLDKSLLDIISDPDAGTPEDKMRLFLIYYISAQQAPSEADLEQYKKALTDAGCDLNPLQYIKQWKAFAKMASAPASYGNTTTKPMGLLSRVMNTGSQFVMEGVKNLVLKQQNLPVTRILDNLMEMKSNPQIVSFPFRHVPLLSSSASSQFISWLHKTKVPTIQESEGGRILHIYLIACVCFSHAYFIHQRSLGEIFSMVFLCYSSVPRNKNPFQEAIVFVVGGGNYIEYQNLVDYIKGKQGKHILYGCSELFNATQFIKQLSQLGQK
ncbi:sec1 family domain-containing protein 1 [Pteropus vampyrus]|uniref:Sec1 family domain-containing protein 1 n=1 Tax=Pteropus vampyrus TaxID=132908 RepID=A0A6P6BPH3_PTEVA|nr:sec1 family domain-containing protein 1 [Pteropus vampyrus]